MSDDGEGDGDLGRDVDGDVLDDLNRTLDDDSSNTSEETSEDPTPDAGRGARQESEDEGEVLDEERRERERRSDGGVQARELTGPVDELTSADAGDVVELPPPRLKKARFGVVGQLLRVWRREKKRRKLAAKGYVEWYLIEDGFPRPKYVKPSTSGGGIPELWHGGVPYLFPRDARVPRKESGMWTVMHRKGDSEPLNPQDPDKNAIPADVLKEYLELQVTSGPPSTLDKLDIDLKTVVMGVIGVVIIYAVIQGGGIV